MIGLFNDCFPPVMDGVSITVKNYADKLQRRGTEVCVVTPDEPGLAPSRFPYPILTYTSLPIPLRHPYRYGMPQMDIPFLYRLGHTPFSLVHAHSPFSAGRLAQRVARRCDIPFIATFHSKYRDDFMRVFHSNVIVDYLIRQLVAFYESADEVWVPQPSVAETLRSYGYHGEVSVVDNGSDYADNLYSPLLRERGRQVLGLDADEPLLLFVGQHIWEKNVGLILNALARLTDRRWHMLFVGEGYARSEMMAMARQLGLTGHDDYRQDRVTFMGCVHDRELLRDLYAAADLFLFPSLYDNAPLVVREAAAMHTPTVATRGSNTAEVISDGRNGFLANADTEDFAKAVAHLLEHPALITAAGDQAARTLVRSWTDIAEEVADRYNHLRARHARRAVAM